MKTKTILAVLLLVVLSLSITSVIPLAPKIQAQEPEATTTSQQGSVQVSAPDIQRGSTQTIKIQADPGKVIGVLTYPSGHQVLFQGNTDENGALDYSFKVGPNTKPGTFNVDIITPTGEGSTTFNVSPKGALIPPEAVPTPEPEAEPEVPTEEPAINITEPEVPEQPEIPVEENTTTAPEEPIVVAPENETTTVTPDNGTDISIPINDTSVVIPSNETTVPEPVQNDTEVIVAPSNETEIVTPDNATDVQEIPDEAIDLINDTSVIVPGNETEVAENVTASEPTIPDLTPISNETTAGNVTDIVVAPPANVTGLPEEITPSENITEALPPANVTEVPTEEAPMPESPPIENVTEETPAEPIGETPVENVTETPPIPIEGNVTITEPVENVTAEAPSNITVETPTEGGNVTIETPDTNVTVSEPPANVTETPEEAIDQGEQAADVLDEAVESGNVDEIITAMQDAIQAVQKIVIVVPEATDEEKDNAEDTVNRMNSLISDAFNEVSE